MADMRTVPELIATIEADFECQAGAITSSMDWAELKKRIQRYRKYTSIPKHFMLPYMLGLVRDFNEEVIRLPIPETPTRLSVVRKRFAHEILTEELDEFMSANTMEEEVDAMIDLAYYALGRIVEMGVSPPVVFEEVHAANMCKERGERGREAHSLGHDAIKPEGWVPPNIKQHLGPEKPQKKFLVIGHGRHGKDTVCEIMRDEYGLAFQSSSIFCAEKVMLPYFNAHAHLPSYESSVACYADRHNTTTIPDGEGDPREVAHRTIWYNQIRDFNRPDPTALGRAILKENDVYCGLRHAAEFNACKNAGLFDAIIWVDASGREPAEAWASCTVEKWMADYVVDNNGTLTDLQLNVRSLMSRLLEETS